MDDDVRTSHTLSNRFAIADITLGECDLVTLGVSEIDQINTRDVIISIRAQIAHKIDAEETADASDVNLNDDLLC